MRAQAAAAVSGLRSDLWGKALLLLLCLVPIALYLPILDSPFERDEGAYATIAQGLLDGKVPYRDLFDNKPPLVYGWYALSFLIFGESVAAPRLLAAVLLSATTLAVFAQARLAFSRRVAYLAAGIFAIATGLPFVALHANTEAYMLLPLAGALWAFTIGLRSGKLQWFALAGVLCGAAIMTKQVAVWNVLALGVVALLLPGDAFAGQRRIAPVVFVCAGVAAVVAVIATPFYAAGALDDLAYANLSYNWLYVRFLTLGERLLDLTMGASFIFALFAPVLVAAALGLLAVLRRSKRPVDYLVVAWALASALGVASGGRFFPHYFLQLVPAIALLSSIALYRAIPSLRPGSLSGPRAAFWGTLAIISLSMNALLYAAPWRTEQHVAPNVFVQKQWEEDSVEIGRYIADHTGPGDSIFNLGREPQIYFYADRPPATTYFYDWAYQYDPTTIAATIEALQQDRPAYVIDTIQAPLMEPEQRPPEFTVLLHEHYDYVGRIHFADIYRLKAGD